MWREHVLVISQWPKLAHSKQHDLVLHALIYPLINKRISSRRQKVSTLALPRWKVHSSFPSGRPLDKISLCQHALLVLRNEVRSCIADMFYWQTSPYNQWYFTAPRISLDLHTTDTYTSLPSYVLEWHPLRFLNPSLYFWCRCQALLL